MYRIGRRIPKIALALSIAFALSFTGAVAPATAQEPGEGIKLRPEAELKSLKDAPLMNELLDLLVNRHTGDPFYLPERRPSFLPAVLPDLKVFDLNIDPLRVHMMNPEAEPGDILVPPNENQFVDNREAAERLGKALFWDMQVGSDGVQACGTCHFQSGVDARVKNQLSPGIFRVTEEDVEDPDNTLQVRGPNEAVTPGDFPFHKLVNFKVVGEPLLNPSNVERDANDIMSSMGVRFGEFDDIPAIGDFLDPFLGVRALKPDLRKAGVFEPIPEAFDGLRRVEPRHTPTMHGAAFNFDNFWDGRARHDFNGGSISGASDPFGHIFVDDGGVLETAKEPDPNEEGTDIPVRIRFSSLASQAMDPPLSQFEMSFRNRFWAKIGKKMLQGSVVPDATSVTPLANQLVAIDDSVLGPLSNQGGAACADFIPPRPTADDKPGLCTTYREMVEAAFDPKFHANVTKHLEVTSETGWDGAVLGVGNRSFDPLDPDISTGGDPFDGRRLEIVDGSADSMNTNEYTQAEANFSMFFGFGVQFYEQLLIPHDTPFDRFLDENPAQFLGKGSVELGDPEVDADPLTPGKQIVTGLTFQQLHGLDLFQGTNHSGLNFADIIDSVKTARCAQCHVGSELTDHTLTAMHAFVLPDPFSDPESGQILLPKVIPGLLLAEEAGGFIEEDGEFEGGENAQDSSELDNLAFDLTTGVPEGVALLDNGIYNIGVRPLNEDISRGGNDPFGFPLSASALALINVNCDVGKPGDLPDTLCVQKPIYETNVIETDPEDFLLETYIGDALPEYLALYASRLPVGEGGIVTDVPVFEIDALTEPPVAEVLVVDAEIIRIGTWPFPNRVGRRGNFKAPGLRNVELTGPYMHNGGMLTLRQVMDFYGRGGDFPETNKLHRDPHIISLIDNTSASGKLTDAELDALVAFMLALTDERVRNESAPFDRPEIFVPIDGEAPDNNVGRLELLDDTAAGLFLQVAVVGAAGHGGSPNFMDVGSTKGPGLDHFDSCTFDTPTAEIPPIANDDAVKMKMGQTKTINVLANDNDPNGKKKDPIYAQSLRIEAGAENGDVLVGGGKVLYAPNAFFTGTDSFTYTFIDAECLTSNEAMVTVTVSPGNPRNNNGRKP